MIGLKDTHNQPIHVNRAQVLHVTTFEEDVSVIALAVAGTRGKPMTIHVRGSVELVSSKLSVPPATLCRHTEDPRQTTAASPDIYPAKIKHL